MFGFDNGRNVWLSKYTDTTLAGHKNVTLLDWGGLCRFTSEVLAIFRVAKLYFEYVIFKPTLTAKRLYKTWHKSNSSDTFRDYSQ